jgi:AraC-like DNA-binding protein
MPIPATRAEFRDLITTARASLPTQVDSTGYVELPHTDGRIDALWVATAPRGASPPPSRIPPDACVDVIVRCAPGKSPEFIIHGPALRYHFVPVSAGELAVGTRFRPGVAGPLFAEPGRALRALVAADPSGLLDPQRLADLALPMLQDFGPPPALVTDFVSAVEECRGGAKVRDVLARLGAHERALQRAAAKWIGMTPRSFARTIRVCAARDTLRGGARIVDVAADFGFADQAHLSRDFREQLGTTPAACRVSSRRSIPTG